MQHRVAARVVALAIACLAGTAAATLAAEPITWKRPYPANAQLTWKFAGSYPQWLTEPVATALNTNWGDRDTNNSQTPRFSISDKGLGRVFYSSSINSPCNPVNPIWLASACTAGQTAWKIYVRNLDLSRYSNWVWFDKPNACTSSKTCFQLRRTLIHEPIHLTGGGSVHSTQSPDLTVFLRGQSSNAHAIGRYYQLRACDEAGAQTAYDLRDFSGPYSTCLGSLATQVSVTGTLEACQGLPVLVAGRLAVRDSKYARLDGNPLAGRVLNLDLDGKRVASMRALSTSGNNWSTWLPGVSVGAHTYTAHFDGDAPLKASPAISVTVVWVPHAEC